MKSPITFLTVPEIQVIHETMIARYGGTPGIRDRGLLESAVSAVEFAAHYANKDRYDLAAVLLVRIIKDQLFVDGNKRTAVAAARIFLHLNGIRLASDPAFLERLESLVIRVASDDATETHVAALLRDWPVTSSP